VTGSQSCAPATSKLLSTNKAEIPLPASGHSSPPYPAQLPDIVPMPMPSVRTDFSAKLTWWQALLELLRLLRVVQHQCVEVSRAPDLELGHRVGFAGSLALGRGGGGGPDRCLLDTSNCHVSGVAVLHLVKRTSRILPTGHLEELLDVLDLLGLLNQ
jgi:hypothetical protein